MALTGTQADPYIVTTWSEIMEKIAEPGVYIRCTPGLTFDMNELYPNGAPQMTFNCKEFDGNGLIIKNGRYTSDAFYMPTRDSFLKKVKFLNFLIQGNGYCLIRYDQGGKLTVEDCVFSGQSTSSEAIIRINRSDYSSITIDFYRCGFNVQGIGEFLNKKGSSWDGDTSFIDSHIIYTGSGISSNTSHNWFHMVNSLLEGEITSSVTKIHTSNDSIINLTAPYIGTLSGTTSLTHVIVNSDKASVSSGSSFIPLTDTELQDVQAVAATGFPIGGTS